MSGQQQAEACAEPSVGRYVAHAMAGERPCDGCYQAFQRHTAEWEAQGPNAARRMAQQRLMGEFPERYRQLLEGELRAGGPRRDCKRRARAALCREQPERYADLRAQARAGLILSPVTGARWGGAR